MASITKRTYKKKSGQVSTYWQVSYYDTNGKRARQNFDKQSKAYEFKVKVEGQLLTGQHIPDKSTVTLKQAALLFLNDFERAVQAGTRERSTFQQYRGHVNNHLAPHPLANQLLTSIQTKDCRLLLDGLMAYLSGVQAAKVMVTLRMIFSFGMERGWILGNPASTVKVRKDTRKKESLYIPPKRHIRLLIDTAAQMDAFTHAFACVGFFCGLRVSEMRGLMKSGIVGNEIHVTQRADQWNRLGAPKTSKGRRIVPMGELTREAVGKWLKMAPGAFLFGTSAGTPYNYQNLLRDVWLPLFKKAGLEPFGFHIMRHVAASLWIEGGKKPKWLMDKLGHSSITMTMDTYGHLWPDEEDDTAASSSEKSIMGTK